MSNEFIVSEDQAGRLDHFLTAALSGYTRGEAQTILGDGHVFVNDKAVLKNSAKVKGGDQIRVVLPERLTELQAGALDIPILYEDEWIVVVNKPAGMIVHPTTMNQEDTLVNALLGKYPTIRDAVYDTESTISRLRPGIVHRLDKNTSGVLLVARTAEAMAALSKQFHDHTVTKEYVALVAGREVEEQTVSTGIRRKPAERTMMGIAPSGVGKNAVTHMHPVKKWPVEKGFATYVEFTIETGRTHQIRVHCKYKGFPVLGDAIYDNKLSAKLSEKLGVERQLLHAARLSFNHPHTGQRMGFEAPLPEDFTLVLTKLGPADTLK